MIRKSDAQGIRVMIVDDSAVVRTLVSSLLESEEGIAVVGTARNGRAAIEMTPRCRPQVVILDINMPEMDGLQTLKELKKSHPDQRVIMFSTLTKAGAAETLEALASGASDYVTKPSGTGSREASLAKLRGELVPKIKQFFRPIAPKRKEAVRPQARKVLSLPRPSISPKAVVVGVSTGGPNALAKLLGGFPAHFPLPVLIVQHMPPTFTALLAKRLDQNCALKVKEAVHGQEVEQGTVLLAPGDYHLRVVKDGLRVLTSLDQGPPRHSCRPAADNLFESAAKVWGGASIGVILTGMGQDGLAGLRSMRAAGARVIAQDRATSVVWGMPGAVAEAGLAQKVLPLAMIYEAIAQFVSPVHMIQSRMVSQRQR